jgi:hypothetical protein
MAFDVQNFVDNIGNRGTLKNNSFEVDISRIPAMLNDTLNRNFGVRQPDIRNLLRLRANRVTLPGINLDLANVKRYGVGPISRAPTSVNYTNMNIEFIETADHSVYKFLYEWVTTMFDFTGAGGNQINSAPRYNAEYAAYYSTDMLINVYDPSAALVTQVRVIEAYPSSIGDKPLSWNDNNSTYKIDSTFTFKEWKIENYATAGTIRSNVPDIVPFS